MSQSYRSNNYDPAMEWTVVKFFCDEKISHVPTKWLMDVTENNVGFCFWPKKNAGKQIIDQSDPIPLIWDKLEVTLLKQTDSYMEAREYLKLMSEGESAPETNQPLGKGCRKPKKRNLFDTFEGESDTDNEDCPPRLEFDFEITKKQTQNTCSQRSEINPSQTQVNKKSIFRTVSRELTVTALQQSSTAPEETITPKITHNCNCNNIEESPILRNILANIISCRKMLEHLTEQPKEANMDDSCIKDFNLVPKKQFSKYKKLKEFDKTLNEDKQAERQNETALFLVGGTTYKEMVRRGLKKIFADKLATKCSWTGRKNNFKLCDLKILEILKIATRKKFGSMSDAEFQAEVGLWFRQGKLRLDRSQAREDKKDRKEETME